MPGSGSKAKVDAVVARRAQERRKALDQPGKRLGLPCPVVDDAGPERDAIGVQSGGDIDGAAEEIDPAGAGSRIGADERRLVLMQRVEQEPGAGFDDAAEVVCFQRTGDVFKLRYRVARRTD